MSGVADYLVCGLLKHVQQLIRELKPPALVPS